MTLDEYDAYVRALADAAPPLTEEQRREVRRALAAGPPRNDRAPRTGMRGANGDQENDNHHQGNPPARPCADCDSRPRQGRYQRCSRCLRAAANGARAKRAAEQRLQPLVDIVGAP